MKNFYLVTLVALTFVAALSPQKIIAQCTCAGGVPATAEVHNVTLDSLTSIVGTVTFPQFNPATGTLSCVDVNYHVTSVLSFTLKNFLDSTKTYRFNYTQFSGLDDGFGLNINNSVVKNYGPYVLGPLGSVAPLDSVSVGPDTLFNLAFFDATTTYVAPYLGTGTVDITYDNSYSTHFTAGSNNFDLKVRGYAKGPFVITYYWCPASVLARTITNFLATKQGNYVQLQWQALNDQNNINYEIEYSKDGVHYSTVGKTGATAAATGTVSEYKYQYNIDPADVGQLYFRIKKIDANGKISYSNVKTVNVSAFSQGGLQTYPNPVLNKLTMEFDEKQTGNFMVELVNTAGQVILRKAVSLSSGTLINLDLDNHPAKGLYFLRAKDITHDKQFITKILIE